jgi:hypothetical protein
LNIGRLGRENRCYKKFQRIAVVKGRLGIRIFFLKKSPDSVEVLSVVRNIVFLHRILRTRFLSLIFGHERFQLFLFAFGFGKGYNFFARISIYIFWIRI